MKRTNFSNCTSGGSFTLSLKVESLSRVVEVSPTIPSVPFELINLIITKIISKHTIYGSLSSFRDQFSQSFPILFSQNVDAIYGYEYLLIIQLVHDNTIIHCIIQISDFFICLLFPFFGRYVRVIIFTTK